MTVPLDPEERSGIPGHGLSVTPPEGPAPVEDEPFVAFTEWAEPADDADFSDL